MSIQNAPRARSLSLAGTALLCTILMSSFAIAQGTAQKPPAANAPAANPPPALPAATAGAKAGLKVKLTSLEDWDSQVDLLLRVSQQVYAGTTSEDLGGHDLEYYWQQYVLTSATKDKLDALRDKAQKQSVAKDTAGFQHTLDEASAIFTAEQTKGYILVMFLSAQAPVNFHQYQLGPWLARAKDADRQAINDRVIATYDRLSKELTEVIKTPDPDNLAAVSERFSKVTAEPLAFFNTERERLVKEQADQPNPVAVSPRTRGNKPCPAPVPPVKGRARASLAQDFPSSESFYPPNVKQNDVEGSVTLRVTISETGCIQKAEVAGTSGVGQLDEGALDLAMAGSYVPAAGPGDKPVASTMMFRVKFEQPDLFKTQK
jgi:TonB family protein